MRRQSASAGDRSRGSAAPALCFLNLLHWPEEVITHVLGDLPAGFPVSTAETYDTTLAEGVKRFQRRHGLDGDGRVGPSTVKQLNVPLSDRVRQLQLTLERWRWLPTEFAAPPIIVNVPDFRLRALDENNNITLEMGVVGVEECRAPFGDGEEVAGHHLAPQAHQPRHAAR